MSELPEIPVEKQLFRWKSQAISLQESLFNMESLAEAILEQRDEYHSELETSREIISSLQEKLREATGSPTADTSSVIEGDVV